MWVVFAALLTGTRPEPDLGEEEIQALVDAARGGDTRAADRLYSLFVGRVHRAVRPLLGSDAEAEDVTQDSFVKALTSLRRYRRRPGVRFVAWLMTIALNTARKRARRGWRTSPTEPARLDRLSDRVGPLTPDPLGEAEDLRRLRARLLEALAELPERDRRAVSLRYGAGLGAKEVGEILGIEPAHVRKICERQRKRLLERLRDDAPGAPEEVRP